MNKNELIEKYENIKLYYNDQSFLHPSFLLETQLLDYLKNGNDLRAVETLNNINKLERARLANSTLRSVKNSLICSCTLFTRAVLEVGVNPEDSFNLSDACIQKIESINDEKFLLDFEYEMLNAFLQLKKDKSLIKIYPDEINKCINYIYTNIFKQISLEDLSNHVYLSPNYLSYKFKNEVGISISEYINKTKINESKYLLIHSNTSLSDIAFIFNFCNQSYYTRLFKKHTGLTPIEFKNQ